MAELRLLLLGVGRVLHRHDPLRRALEEGQVRHLLHHAGHDLDRTGARADDADALSGQRHVVVPACAVEDRAGKGVESLDVRVRGVVQDTRARLVLLTAHRRESFGEPLREVFAAVRELADRIEDVRIVYPVHPNPNVAEPARELLSGHPRILLTEPLDYFDMVAALRSAHLVLTDSGGIQEEAPTFGAPVLVLRRVTGRVILAGLGVIFAGSLAVDLVRLSKPGANRLFYRLFPSLLTPRDAGRLASSTWYVLGVLVVFLLFDQTIAIAATLVLAVADPVGNVVGRTVGKRPFGTGTVEGTLGLVAASFLAIVALVGPLHAAAASLATGWAETRRVPVDDNLTVPLAAGFVLWLMTLLP